MNPEHAWIHFKLLREGAVPPTRGTSLSGAFDLYAPNSGFIGALSTVTIGLGIAHRCGGPALVLADFPDATQDMPVVLQGLMFGRSGLAAKRGIRPFFAPCLIDNDYRGEIMLTVENTTEEGFFYKQGDRLCQIMYLPTYSGPCAIVEELDETERGTGGHGSTGGVTFG